MLAEHQECPRQLGTCDPAAQVQYMLWLSGRVGGVFPATLGKGAITSLGWRDAIMRIKSDLQIVAPH